MKRENKIPPSILASGKRGDFPRLMLGLESSHLMFGFELLLRLGGTKSRHRLHGYRGDYFLILSEFNNRITHY